MNNNLVQAKKKKQPPKGSYLRKEITEYSKGSDGSMRIKYPKKTSGNRVSQLTETRTPMQSMASGDNTSVSSAKMPPAKMQPDVLKSAPLVPMRYMKTLERIEKTVPKKKKPVRKLMEKFEEKGPINKD